MIEEIGQSEAYVMGTSSSEGRLYHLIVDSEFTFSISNLQDAVIKFLFCLDILNSLLVFIQQFVFSLTTGTIPSCVVNLFSKLE